jgi:hypothetical protein
MALALIVFEKSRGLPFRVETDQQAPKIALAIEGLKQANSDWMACKPFVVGRFVESPIESGGCDFQCIAVRYQVLDVEDDPDFVADVRAILVGNSARFINIDTQEGVSASAGHFGMNQL